MVRRNKEFNEIYDLAGLRVLAEDVRDCLRYFRRYTLDLEADTGAFQGLRRDAEVQYVPVAAYDGHVARREAVGDPDPDRRYGPDRRVRHRRPLDVQGGPQRDSDVDRLAWLTSMMEWQKETTDSTEFMESLKGELGADEVYVFTPKGDVISLPSGATPIDFAYHVHTEVGQRTIGAKVNDRIVPLDSELVSGDRVEVITGKSSGPSRDWLEVVQSGRARNKIRQFFNKEDREDNLASGREKGRFPAQEAAHREGAFGYFAGGRPEHAGYGTPDDMLVAVGAGSISAENVANRIAEHLCSLKKKRRRPAAEARRSRRCRCPVLRRGRGRGDRGSGSGVQRRYPHAGSRGAARRCRGMRSWATSHWDVAWWSTPPAAITPAR